jgi:hemoglobin-like flavoprotein
MDIDPKCDDLKNSRRFMQHAAFLISMIDKTVNMLGVDNAELTETLTGLGKMHVTYGVQASYFPMMTESIVFMLKNQLGNEFQHSDNSAWRHVLSSLIAAMIKGQRSLDKGLAASNKHKVIATWRSLMQQKNYEEQAGVILFTQ